MLVCVKMLADDALAFEFRTVNLVFNGKQYVDFVLKTLIAQHIASLQNDNLDRSPCSGLPSLALWPHFVLSQGIAVQLAQFPHPFSAIFLYQLQQIFHVYLGLFSGSPTSSSSFGFSEKGTFSIVGPPSAT